MSTLTKQLEGSVALERVKSGELEAPTPNAMQLIQSAIAQGSSIDTIERLAALQREMVEYQAKVEFNEAMQRVQHKMRRISADAHNPQTKSRYASYAKLDSVLRPIYAEEGFSLSFNTGDSPVAECVRVLCDVSRGGYTKHYQIDMPADGKGAKGGDVMTKTHATGAATQYGMRYLVKMIFNVAVGEDDNDGNGAESVTPAGQMDTDEFDYHLQRIETAKEITNLFTIFKAAYVAAQKINDQSASRQFGEAKEKRKKELA